MERTHNCLSKLERMNKTLGHQEADRVPISDFFWGSFIERWKEELKEVVLTKLNAAKGGGYIFQSDHSVPSNISGENYDYVLNLVREYGRYPLDLGEYDLPEIS